MTVRIGVIGTGDIGRSHIKRITNELHGGKIVALTDVNYDNAKLASSICGARILPDYPSLINDPEVDAVIVASWDAAHEEHVIACINAGKPVLCEKPLSTSLESCQRIVDAEMNAGKRLVKLGFMRRYDAGYSSICDAINSNTIGNPLIFHCVHRNKNSYAEYCTENSIKSSTVHEIDLIRWMLNEDYRTIQITTGKATRSVAEGIKDPLSVLLESNSGVRIDVEVFVNSGIGYEVYCTVVGEEGVLELSQPSNMLLIKPNVCSRSISDDWKIRFHYAYNALFQEWINEVATGKLTNPSAWDGLMATHTAEIGVKALHSGNIEEIPAMIKPDFYK